MPSHIQNNTAATVMIHRKTNAVGSVDFFNRRAKNILPSTAAPIKPNSPIKNETTPNMQRLLFRQGPEAIGTYDKKARLKNLAC
jgi:hypothetical protein